MLHFRGLERNSLTQLVNQIQDNDGEMDIIGHSAYYDNDKLINEMTNKRNSYKIISLNCQSINAKIDNLKLVLNQYADSDCELQAICLQETWLADDSDTSLLQLDGYHLISKGKTCSSHGGLLIYLKNNLKFEIIDIINDCNIWEEQFIRILFNKPLVKNVILGNIYRPPRDLNEVYQQFIDEFTAIFGMSGNTNCDVIIAGDYNIDLLKIHEKAIFSDYFDAITSLGFFPKITLPTRFSDLNGTLIDNFICKFPHRILNITAGILISRLSDHLPYFLSFDEMTIKPKQMPKCIETRHYGEQNILKLRETIHAESICDKLDLSDNADPNNNYEILENTITDAMSKHIPIKTVRYNKHKHQKSVWITKGLTKSMHSRDKLYMKLMKMNQYCAEYNIIKTNLRTFNRILRIMMAKWISLPSLDTPHIMTMIN